MRIGAGSESNKTVPLMIVARIRICMEGHPVYGQIHRHLNNSMVAAVEQMERSGSPGKAYSEKHAQDMLQI